MDRLLGTDVEVHLKTNDIVCGKLFDIEDDYVYIQNSITNFITIPKDNIKYFVSNSSQSTATGVGDNSGTRGRASVRQISNMPDNKAIEVFIDGEHLVSIPVIPTTDLSVFSDFIMHTVLSNPDVQSILSNRVQESIEYVPGKVMFMTTSVSEPSLRSNTTPNSFSMGGSGNGDPSSSFVNPSQMVSRLNKVTQEKRDEKKTKM